MLPYTLIVEFCVGNGRPSREIGFASRTTDLIAVRRLNHIKRKDKSMARVAGLWIDHRKALIVVATDEGEEVKLIESTVEKQLRRSGDSPLKGPHESQIVPADDSRQRKLSMGRRTYYDAVVECIRNSDSILIFGPGEAKGELKTLLTKDKLGDRIVHMESADKMTDRQVSAKVREYFR
jgi:hypothetical protein